VPNELEIISLPGGDMKMPFLKFFPRDWMGETALQCLDYSARGLWIEMICLMSTSERYGYLIFGGQALTPAQIARMTRGTEAQVKKLLNQLFQQGVYNVCPETGAIYSRRMVKEAELHQVRSVAGRRGAIATHGLPFSDDETNFQKPDARNHIPELANNFAMANVRANELANGLVNAKANLSVNPPSWEQVEQASEGLGITKKSLDEFFTHFESVGWVTKHGQPLRSLKAAIKKWSLNGQYFGERGTSEKSDTRKGRLS
jgi:hypothetical protein